MGDVLVLNSTYEVLGIIDLERAVCMLYQRQAEIVHDSGRRWRSVTSSIALPSIVRMLYYVKRATRQRLALTKKNVLLRDDYRCAYCGEKGGALMTVDHIQPKSRGGRSSWENLVSCCSTCNGRKRDRTPAEAGMPLRTKPREPRSIPWVTIKRNTYPGEWSKYLTLYSVSV